MQNKYYGGLNRDKRGARSTQQNSEGRPKKLRELGISFLSLFFVFEVFLVVSQRNIQEYQSICIRLACMMDVEGCLFDAFDNGSYTANFSGHGIFNMGYATY